MCFVLLGGGVGGLFCFVIGNVLFKGGVFVFMVCVFFCFFFFFFICSGVVLWVFGGGLELWGGGRERGGVGGGET